MKVESQGRTLCTIGRTRTASVMSPFSELHLAVTPAAAATALTLSLCAVRATRLVASHVTEE